MWGQMKADWIVTRASIALLSLYLGMWTDQCSVKSCDLRRLLIENKMHVFYYWFWNEWLFSCASFYVSGHLCTIPNLCQLTIKRLWGVGGDIPVMNVCVPYQTLSHRNRGAAWQPLVSVMWTQTTAFVLFPLGPCFPPLLWPNYHIFQMFCVHNIYHHAWDLQYLLRLRTFFNFKLHMKRILPRGSTLSCVPLKHVCCGC